MNIKNTVALLTGAANNVNGTANVIDMGGKYLWMVDGTFDGNTVKMQILGPDGTNYIDFPNCSATAAGVVEVELPTGAVVRGTNSDDGTPSNNSTLQRIR